MQWEKFMVLLFALSCILFIMILLTLLITGLTSIVSVIGIPTLGAMSMCGALISIVLFRKSISE